MRNENVNEPQNQQSCQNAVSKRLPSISIGQEQPVDCEECKDKLGYQYSDYMSLHYTSFHDSDGKHEGGQYSEGSKNKNLATTPYCCNCGGKLKFKLVRTEFEQTETKQYPKGSYFV